MSDELKLTQIDGIYSIGAWVYVDAGSSQVRGDSMVDLGIFEDDLVVVKPQITARNGEIVVALINGGQDGTVKVYEDRDGRPKLKARNATYGEERSTIYFRDERDGIIGKVISLIRRY